VKACGRRPRAAVKRGADRTPELESRRSDERKPRIPRVFLADTPNR
jgi:hypothetical protein